MDNSVVMRWVCTCGMVNDVRLELGEEVFESNDSFEDICTGCQRKVDVRVEFDIRDAVEIDEPLEDL